VSRLAALAAAKGGKTRAIIKVLGRGAIALTVAASELAFGLLWVLLLLAGWCMTAKHLTERAALRFFLARKVRRATVAA
jgi:hypothetical protein